MSLKFREKILFNIYESLLLSLVFFIWRPDPNSIFTILNSVFESFSNRKELLCYINYVKLPKCIALYPFYNSVY